ncbi:MAG: HAMP domain-containing protein, partial [Aliifodinibius sp.]|nr:HAMP domain-containing protein [Fodinibius sp.]NIV10951.1 HAMP domain-containing protein [Fodinibius sp.]NIY24551.1 HAMP domain-containing protein [Fodinibius sp.]
MLQKIGVKLILAVTVTTIIIIGVYAYFNIRSQSEVLLAEAERHANQLSETVKNSTRYDMLLNQRDRIHKIINTIGKGSDIKGVRILNKVGEIIYSSNQAEIGKMVDKQAESCYACHTANEPLRRLSIKERTRIFRIHSDSSRIMGIINPIYTERSCWEADCHAHSSEQTVLGVLDVTMSLKDIDNQIQKSELNILLFAVIAIVALGFIIGFFVTRWVDKPVHELVDATRHVAVGNLNYTIKDQRNDELGMLAKSFNNMTQKLSEARMQLFQSDKMASLGRLAAGVAHEINNPLTGVLTYSSYLLKRAKDNPELQDDLKVIVRETKRSREIVKGLLDFARQSVPKKNEANINEIINRAVTVVENQLTINKIQLNNQFDKNLPNIKVDANQIQQVFINLLVNAIDAIEKDGGKITLSTSLISLIPYGIMQIKKAVCAKGHDLIDNTVPIDGMPSIKLKTRVDGKEGFIHLDPIYGKNRDKYDLPVNGKNQVQISCPQCNRSMLVEDMKCPKCSAAVYQFEIPQQGQFEGCVNETCDWQKWEAVDIAGEQRYIQIKVKDNG